MLRGGQAGFVLVEAVAFGCELALLETLGVTGWHFGGGALISIALAALYPALAVLIWSVWLAQTAAHRLGDPARLALQIALFLATAVASGLAGRLLWGVALAAVAVAALVTARVLDGTTGR